MTDKTITETKPTGPAPPQTGEVKNQKRGLPLLRTEKLMLNMGRLDYVCAMYNNFAYVRAVEKLLGMKVPDRAEYLRTIVAEVQRIIGHLFWLGTQALDIGAMTVFFYTFLDREILLDFFDELCGARLTTSWYRIGGVERDFTPELIEKLRRFVDYFPPKIDEYVTFLETNRIWLSRTKSVAVIS